MNRDSIFDSAEKLMKHHGEAAKEKLIERLKDGKRVGRSDLHDLLDCELNSDRYPITRDDLMQILTAQNDSRAHLADQFIDAMIGRYLATHEDLVMEEAEQMASAEDE